MRVLTGLAVLALLLSIAPVSAEEKAEKKKAKPAGEEEVKVYTNKDLEKLFGRAEKAEPAAAKPEGAKPGEAAAKPDAEKPDPLAWMQQRQKARAEHAKAVDEAQKTLALARERVTNLERQLLATRNPFAARPDLSDEEREKRAKAGETAAQRNERTQKMLDEARVAVTAAEVELRRVQAQRP